MHTRLTTVRKAAGDSQVFSDILTVFSRLSMKSPLPQFLLHTSSSPVLPPTLFLAHKPSVISLLLKDRSFELGNAVLFPELMVDLISDNTNTSSFSFSLSHTHTHHPHTPHTTDFNYKLLSIRMPGCFLALNYKIIITITTWH